MDALNVTAAKPKVGGALWSAVLGTALPTDATTTLNEAFKDLGFLSEDGVEAEKTSETDLIKAWGGTPVLNTYKGFEDTFKYTLIESLNIEAMKEVYGADNVTGTLSTGITIKANGTPLPEHPIVIDMILKGGVIKRIVIPYATITEVGPITYKDDEATGYEITVSATADTNGNTHYEYIKKA